MTLKIYTFLTSERGFRGFLELVYNIIMDKDKDLSGNVDIQEALKEFEAKSNIEELKKSPFPEASKIPETSKMVGWVIKYSGGYIKEERQAEYVLFGFVVLAIVVSLFLFFGRGESEIPPLPPPTPFTEE